MYAIVDIETTGGFAASHGITEICIVVFDGVKVIDKFESLINPCQPIPRYIQAFTGIDDNMVKNAPRFEEVAEKVYQLLASNVFVAHNVNFDYSFIKCHLETRGYSFNTKRLCTVRLSRKILPGFPSYSLGNLCSSMNIHIENRHRAGGDAMATVKVFEQLIAADKENFIAQSLNRMYREQTLPPNVPKEHFDNLPSSPGVYYFHDQKGKVIYVGKARNLRQRVHSHFTGPVESRQKQNFIRFTHSISFEKCATELMACILESAEIKKLWPSFNYAQKRWEDIYGLFCFPDQNGYLRLAVEKNKKHITPLHTFHYLAEGHGILRKMIGRFDLCPKLCYIQTDSEICESINGCTCKGACLCNELPQDYNRRVEMAIETLTSLPSYAIVDKGLHDEHSSCIVVEKGKLYGMGYIPKEIQVTHLDTIKEYVKLYRDNNTIRNMLNTHMSRNPGNVKHF